MNSKQRIPHTRACIFYRLLALTVSLALPAAAFAQAVSIGKLFTSPEEREYLDYLRQDFVTKSQLSTFNIVEDVVPDIPLQEQPAAAVQEVVEYKFGGILALSNGNRMVWLNGRQVAERDLQQDMSLSDTPSGTLLNIRSNGTLYSLKPGQTLNVRTGSVSDSYQSTREAPVTPPAASTQQGNAAAVTANIDNLAQASGISEAVTTGNDNTAVVSQARETATEPGQPTTFESILEQMNTEAGPVTDPEFRNALESIFNESRDNE